MTSFGRIPDPSARLFVLSPHPAPGDLSEPPSNAALASLLGEPAASLLLTYLSNLAKGYIPQIITMS